MFAAFLIATGVKMPLLKTNEMDPDRNLVVRLTRRLFPVSERFHGQHFFVRAGSAASHDAATLLATPLFLDLVMVEFTDVIFAVDSIPAIFAITADPFRSSPATCSRSWGCAASTSPSRG